MSRNIFIGDIHGCLLTFKSLVEQLNIVKGEDQVVLLGDYIDRGPDSKGVIDEIIRLQNLDYNLIPLKGNHEQMLIYNHHSETIRGWYDMADEELKDSFKINNLKQLPLQYIDFCKQLRYYYSSETFIAVHAGLNFTLEDPLSNNEDLMWIREWYDNINYNWLKDKIIIHGHTPISKNEIIDQFNKINNLKALNIDCGAYLSKSKHYGLGHLCAFDLTNMKLYFQENIDPACNY